MDPSSKPDRPARPVHGYTGPTTPAEDAARETPSVSPEDAARIAEEASRVEDA